MTSKARAQDFSGKKKSEGLQSAPRTEKTEAAARACWPASGPRTGGTKQAPPQSRPRPPNGSSPPPPGVAARRRSEGWSFCPSPRCSARGAVSAPKSNPPEPAPPLAACRCRRRKTSRPRHGKSPRRVSRPPAFPRSGRLALRPCGTPAWPWAPGGLRGPASPPGQSPRQPRAFRLPLPQSKAGMQCRDPSFTPLEPSRAG
uniref:Uncharacterized protein n=1 Tax=Rangifer tarandus platyrhynchus TaxID=3082113 RepID=A0ACB0E2Z8_RANTA|nr:unnamed protein product [Rangifer tarandus platyrhynchus]